MAGQLFEPVLLYINIRLCVFYYLYGRNFGMADVNATTAPIAAQPIVLGNKLLTPGADGKTVKISNKDGTDAQSMDLEAFKKYLAEHKEEIIAQANKQPGDTVNFKGKPEEEATEEAPKKKGLSTGTLILGAATLAALGLWKKDLVVKYWKQAVGFFNKAKPEVEKLTEIPGKDAGPYVNMKAEYFKKNLVKTEKPNAYENICRTKEFFG